jgi:hypothetical protein
MDIPQDPKQEEWKRIGSPTIYEKLCPECKGEGEKKISIVGGGSMTSLCSCRMFAYSFKTKKGYIYETRFE